ncbi:MAG: PAS domain S-box protein [Methylomonas sp.]
MTEAIPRAKVLVVDDQPTNVQILAEALKTEYDVRIATNGERALEIAQKDDKPDLILLDVMMPRPNGFEVCERLKSNPATQHIPVIFITSKDNAADEELGLKIGAIDYISKPFSIPVVRARVRNHLLLKQRSELLQKSEEHFRSTFEAAPIGVTNSALDGRLLEVNQGLIDFLGYTRDELLEMTTMQLSAPEFQQQDADWTKKALDGEIAEFNYEKQYICKNGMRVWGHLWVKLIRNAQGLPDHFIRVVEDIERRKQAEAANAMLLQAIEQSPVSVVVTDLEANIEYVNDAFVRNSGYSRGEAIGKNPRIMQSGKTFRETYDNLWATLTSGQVWEGELVNKRKNGEEYIESALIAPVRQSDGSITHFLGIKEDITERIRIQQALKRESEKNRVLLQNASDGIHILDHAGNVIEISEAFCNMLGYQRQELMGAHVSQWEAMFTADEIKETLDRQFAAHTRSQFETYHRRKDGTVFPVEISSFTIELEGNKVHFCSSRDITKRKAAEKKVHLAASVFSHAREGIMITQPDGSIIDVNEAFSLITGYSRSEVLGRNPRILKSGRQDERFYAELWESLGGKGQWYGEVWNRRKNGEVYAQLLTISAVFDNKGSVSHYVALFSDITTSKEHQKQLEHIAHYDALTNLPNRVLLADRLHQGMVQSQRQKKPLAVVYLDLDGFKSINDTYGHEIGDQVLVAVSSRMKRALREVDTLARLGGDEFVAILLNLDDIESSLPLLTRLLNAAAEPFVVGEFVLQVSASLGISFYPQQDEVDADQLLRQADQAMYQAKLAGKNRYYIFDPVHDNNIRGYHETLEHVRRALETQELLLYYQPKVNMSTGQVIGAEALIRWLHPVKGLLLPAVFLPVIEDHALAVDIGEWVIRTALNQIRQWQAAGLDIPVSVNIGARHIQQPDFVERLRKILAEYPGVDPNRLEIEVLETSALEDIVRISQVIEACQGLGVRFALDDFGTGYSSLTYLKRLPVQVLKIDQSFVREMLENPDDLVILDGVIGLSNAFNRTVIAEGVETAEHGEVLLQLGCEHAQGFGIARPMQADKLLGWSAKWQPNAVWGKTIPVSRENLPVIFSGVAHREWMKTVRKYIDGQSEICPPKLHHPCRLGIWLNTDGLNRYGHQPGFDEMEKLHHRVHDMAETLFELHADGKQAEVLARLKELDEVHDVLLEKLKQFM